MTGASAGVQTGLLRNAVSRHVRVVGALMLRDIQTRFGASYFGFLLSLLIPLAHIGVILTVYLMLGRRAPIGTDVMLYLTTAIVPFVLWSYTHRQVMQAFAQNKALTAFPIVGFLDIFVARAVVELLQAMLIVLVVGGALTLLGKNLFIAYPEAFLYALTLAYLLGNGTGLVFGLLSLLTPAILIAGYVMIPLFWVTSGIFFIPDVLPEQARMVVAIFPLTHIVDFGRTAVYASYLSDFYSLLYVHAVLGAYLLSGLLIERLLRPTLTAK